MATTFHAIKYSLRDYNKVLNFPFMQSIERKGQKHSKILQKIIAYGFKSILEGSLNAFIIDLFSAGFMFLFLISLLLDWELYLQSYIRMLATSSGIIFCASFCVSEKNATQL